MQRIGINWFDPPQWELLKASAEDSDKLDDTYEDWLANAGRTAKSLETEGFEVVMIQVDVAELNQWCAERGLSQNGKSRAEFATLKTQHGLGEPFTRKKRTR